MAEKKWLVFYTKSRAEKKTAELLDNALNEVEEATNWLLTQLSDGKLDEALAGSTPYLRLFGLASGGCYLAKAGLGDSEKDRASLARFFAENFAAECAALKHTVTGGAESLAAASELLKAG